MYFFIKTICLFRDHPHISLSHLFPGPSLLLQLMSLLFSLLVVPLPLLLVGSLDGFFHSGGVPPLIVALDVPLGGFVV